MVCTLGAIPVAATAAETAPERVAAVGDSISTGYNAVAPGDAPTLSWSTGSDPAVDSIASRFAAQDGAVETANFAVPGSTAANLPAQVELALQADPTVITIQIGALDACKPTVGDMTPVAAYEDAITDALTAVQATAPDTNVLVTSIPDLKKLWAAGKDNPTARYVWEAYQVCQNLLADPLSDDPADQARRDAVQQQVISYNNVLADLADEFPNVQFDDHAVYNADFTAEHLSPLDFFHPSTTGQAHLADTAWDAFHPTSR